MTKHLDTSTLIKYTSGNNKGHFNWKENIGKELPFQYDDLTGIIKIIDYKSVNRNNLVTIKYQDNVITTSTSNLLQLKIPSFLNKNKNTRQYLYKIGDIIDKEFQESKVIEQTRISVKTTKNYETSILLKIPETSIKEIDFIDWYNVNEYLVYVNNDGYVTAIPIDDKVVLDNADIIYINMDGDIKQDVIDYCVNENKEVILFGLTDDCNCDGDCENCIGHDYDVYKLDDDYIHGFTASKTDDSSYVSYSYYTTEDLSDKDIEKILKAFTL